MSATNKLPQLSVHPQLVRDLGLLVLRDRFDWPAVFSVDSHADVWPWTTYGLTGPSARRPIHGVPLLAALARAVLDVRPAGGRFFVNDCGVSIKPNGLNAELLVEFVARAEHAFEWVRRRSPPSTRRVFETPRQAHYDGRCVAAECPLCIEDLIKLKMSRGSRIQQALADQLLGLGHSRKRRWER